MAERNAVILTFVDYYRPARRFGGMAQAVHHLAEALGDEFHFQIVTRNNDYGDRAPLKGILADVWGPVDKAEVLYLSRTARTPFALCRLIWTTDHDLVYLNGLYSRFFTLLPLFLRRLGLLPRRPWLIAPRGTALPEAQARKSVKKSIFFALAKAMGLYRGIIWHAINEREAQAVRGLFGPQSRIAVASHALGSLAARPKPARGRLKQQGRAKVAFLSRILPGKNLTGALDVLASVAGEVKFDIFGPREDAAYWSECETKIGGAPGNITIEYCGVVAPEDVCDRLADYDLFYLPTQFENYGLVIFEALLAGCPVLISDRTPWRGLEQAAVGWDLPLDEPDRYRDAIASCIDMDEDAHLAMRERAWRYAVSHAEDDGSREKLAGLFAHALEETN